MEAQCLETVSLALEIPVPQEGAPLPTEIQISPGGQVETETKGRFIMDAPAQAAVISAFTASGRDLVIDYEHQSLLPNEAPAAGWITRLIAKGTAGLWAGVNWTPRAAKYLDAREYRYLSPVVLVRKTDGRAVMLHSVALTNTPEIRKLIPIVAGRGAALCARGEAHDVDKEEAMREGLIRVLKLKADAADEAILAAIEDLMPIADHARRPASEEVLAALELKADAKESDVVATIHALKQARLQAGSLEATQAEIKVLKQQAAERQRDELVQTALSAGKITPAQLDWAKDYALRDPEGFRVYVAKAPVVVPLGAAPPAPAQAAGGVLDDSQREINRALGVTDELYLKHTPKAA